MTSLCGNRPCTAKKERAFSVFPAEKAHTKTKHAKTRCTWFYRANVLSVRCTGPAPAPPAVRPGHAGSIQTARQVFRLWRRHPGPVFPCAAHSDIIGPELGHYGGGPAQVLHLLPYSPGRLWGPGHLVLLCGYYGTINPVFWQANGNKKAGPLPLRHRVPALVWMLLSLRCGPFRLPQKYIPVRCRMLG